MLRITLAAVALIAASLYNHAIADQDLDSLLGDLTFGDSNQEMVSSVLMPENPQEDELAPAPSQRLTSTQDDAVEYGIQNPAQPLNPSYIQDIPHPIVATPLAEPTVNFNQYFAAGGMGDACAGGSSSATSCASSSSYCDAPVVCRPHQAPNLPPPSSMLQYLQSDNCYSNIWSGYAAERQKRCDHLHKHIHGTCDCFTKGKSHSGCQSHHTCQAGCGCGHAH